MKNIASQFGKLYAAIAALCKPAPNQFHKRYAEKFTSPDHCQWQGGRLLSSSELEAFNNKQ